MIHLLLTIRAPPHHIVGVIGESAPEVGRAVREMAGADYQAALEAERLRIGERIVAAVIIIEKTNFLILDIRAEEARVAARIRVRAQGHNGVRQSRPKIDMICMKSKRKAPRVQATCFRSDSVPRTTITVAME